MLLNLILLILTLIVLLISSYTDIKTREVPDWISYAFLSTAFGIRLIFSLEYGYSIILSGLLGFLVCFLLAHLLYYTRQWGGGDSKILMGMGASIGITYPFTLASFNLLLFFIFLLFVGAIYGLIWMLILALRNKTLFLKTFRQKLNLHKNIHYLILSLTLLSIIISLFSPLFLPFIILIPLFFYLLLAVFCIEEHFFHKQISPHKLTEGDWVVDDILIPNERKLSLVEWHYHCAGMRSSFFDLLRYAYILKISFFSIFFSYESLGAKKKEEIISIYKQELKKELIMHLFCHLFRGNYWFKVKFLFNNQNLFKEYNTQIKAIEYILSNNLSLKEYLNIEKNAGLTKLYHSKENLILDLLEKDYGYFIRSGKINLTACSELGLRKEQIQLILEAEKKGYIITVLIKEGIPFLPSFLFAYTIAYTIIILLTYFSSLITLIPHF